MVEYSENNSDKQFAAVRKYVSGANIYSKIPAGLAFAVPLVAYLLTMPQGITWAYHGADGGDLITAACTLGVPHPSGYPTYVLLGAVFCKLPVGEIAWRFNLLSAISVAATAWIVFTGVLQITSSRLGGLVAGLSLAFAPLVWSQAIIAEVYALTLFFAGVLVWLSLQTGRGIRRYVLLSGLIFGLALGVHLIILFWLPFVGMLSYAQHKESKRYQPAKPFAAFLEIPFHLWLIGLLAGLSVFAYLPLRTNLGAITWGTPDTWYGFWELVTGKLYHGYLFAFPLSSLPLRLKAFVGYLAQFGGVGLFLAGIGLYRAWLTHRYVLVGGLLSAVLFSVYALGYKTADSYVYLMPIFVLLAIAVGLGVNELTTSFPLNKAWRTVIKGLLPVILLWGGIINGQRLSLRYDDVAEDFWRYVVVNAPQDAVLLTFEDRHTFTLWYAHYVLHQRPDIAIVDPGLAEYPWYQATLNRHSPGITDLPNLVTIFEQQRVYHRPICVVTEKQQIEKQWQLDCTN